jgi:hypothetical protein
MSTAGSFPQSFSEENATIVTIDVPSFSEEDLLALAANPTSPTQRDMQLIGALTLLTLSPFKLSPQQTFSRTAFLEDPWPEHGESSDPESMVEVWMEEFGSLWHSSPVSLARAKGLFIVAGTALADLNHKLTKSAWLDTDNVKHLQWAWKAGEKSTSEELTTAFENRANRWRQELLDVVDGANPIAGEGLATENRLELQAVFSNALLRERSRLLKLSHRAENARGGHPAKSTVESRSTSSKSTTSRPSGSFPATGTVWSLNSLFNPKATDLAAQKAAMEAKIKKDLENALRDPSSYSGADGSDVSAGKKPAES